MHRAELALQAQQAHSIEQRATVVATGSARQRHRNHNLADFASERGPGGSNLLEGEVRDHTTTSTRHIAAVEGAVAGARGRSSAVGDLDEAEVHLGRAEAPD